MDNYTAERRKYKRLPIELKLEVSEIFKQDNIIRTDMNADIKVYDISKAGIGFISTADLPLEYYFNGKIILGEKKRFFYAVVQIVRKSREEKSGAFRYGAEFVGLAPFLADKVDEYAKEIVL